jgi:hypothetical protein
VAQEAYGDEAFERPIGVACCPYCAGDRGYGLCDYIVRVQLLVVCVHRGEAGYSLHIPVTSRRPNLITRSTKLIGDF